MSKHWLVALGLACASLAAAQSGDELNKLQFHGFVTQALMATSHNNYLGMDTRHLSADWTEAALNVNDEVSDKLRVGLQLHYMRLGIFGGDGVNVDWVMGDYRFNQELGVRAGRVKIRWGLYNDTQDYDPGYLWSLLPESIYAVDWRATNLSQNGAEFYGKLDVGERNALRYSLYYGDYTYASNDGYMETFREEGVGFPSPPGGKTPGFDLRWITPAPGLTLGGSLMIYTARGSLVSGTFRQPAAYWPAYYAQYKFKKVFASGQYSRDLQYNIFSVTGQAQEVDPSDQRAWFVMGGYRLTSKLQAGAYYTHYLDAEGAGDLDPANYFRDWVASARYDFSTDVYFKMEGHLMDGNGVGFYTAVNPNGLTPRTNAMVAKIGFTF
jgi:hypothetical protein